MSVYARAILVAIIASSGCMSEEAEQRVCTVTGTTVNIGSTSGGVFTGDLGQGHNLSLNNTNLNLFLVSASGNNVLVDVGSPECLEDIAFPGGTTNQVAMQLGHGYAAKFGDNTQARFFVDAYSNGVMTITYQYPF